MKIASNVAIAVGLSLLAASNASLADEFTYTFYNKSGGASYKGVGATSSDSGSPAVDVTGWFGRWNTDTELEKAYDVVNYSGGVGIKASSNDQHTIDNNYNWKDYLALDFGKLVTLSEVSFGWIGGYNGMRDSDFSVFYADAGYDFKQDIADQSLSLTEANFSLATHVDGSSGSGYVSDSYDSSNGLETAGIKSSVWVISAYSPVLGAGRLDERDDSFKLASISATHHAPKDPPDDVPVPATIALMGAGAAFLRRRFREVRPH